MIRALITTNTSFNALSNPEFTELFRILNPSFTPPGKTALRTIIFERVWNEDRSKIHSSYQTGSYVSLCINGWKTPGHLKWLGICGILRSVQTGNTLIDARRFEDVTLEGENARVVFRKLKQEILTILSYIENKAPKSVLSSVITDSVNFNIGAKKKLGKIYPKMMFLPCHAHQLNLMACNFLTHTSTKEIVSSAK